MKTYYKKDKRKDVFMKATVIISTTSLLFGFTFNVMKYPEYYCKTWRYQLENDIKNGNAQAIEYYNNNYVKNNKILFDYDFLND